MARAMQRTVKNAWEDLFRRHEFTPAEIERLRTCFDGFTSWFDGLHNIMFAIGQLFSIGVGTEGGLVEGGDHVQAGDAIFAGHGFDIAIVATGTEAQFFEYGNGFRVRLFHVADDHVTADQLIESEHCGSQVIAR